MLATAFLAAPVMAQQASITLKNSDIQFCNRQETTWTLTKTASPSGSAPSGSEITFTVTADKSATPGPKTICAMGYVEVTNTGSKAATIGNIVVNLQRQRLVNNQSRWVSASVDVADATNGDAATKANILAAASQEDAGWNALYNSPATYTSGGGVGTFKQNSASGKLEFTDADGNTVWAIQPQQTIAAGATVRLVFNAQFNNDVLNLAPGTSLRTEVIVSFGNAGGRGGSGASGSNIDIDGNGTISNDELNVRSVPTRVTRTLPALTICNDSVSFNDVFSTTGNTTYSTPTWNPYLDPGTELPKTISSSQTWTVKTTANGAGTISNTATLKGTDTYVNVVTGIDPITLQPILLPMKCCSATDLEASVTVSIDQATALTYCTETHFENNSAQATAEMAYFIPTFSLNGLIIGNYNPGNGNTAPNGFKWTGDNTGLTAIKDYVTGGGPTTALTADALNPTSGSGGSLGRHTVTLTLNVSFSGVIGIIGSNPAWPSGFGALTVYGTSSWADGKTVSQILGYANDALASGTLPGGVSLADMSQLVDQLNKSFNNCQQSAWAAGHLH